MDNILEQTRRGFMGTAFGAAGAALLPADAFGTGGRPIMSMGVVSDVHFKEVEPNPIKEQELEKVFRFFDSCDVDAVVSSGDMADSGLISELETYSRIWYKVFPDDRGGDGRHVEKLIVTGNHCVDAWGGRWSNFSEADLRARRFNWGDNPKKVWDRLFHEEWKLIWEKQVKGITFVGSQYRSVQEPFLRPPLEAFFKAKEGKMDPSMPFFFIQHPHPRGTCHGPYNRGEVDQGQAGRALAPFPNAVAISGHSHASIADGRTVWQGAFTSIGAGCMNEAAGPHDCENANYFWHPSSKEKIMATTKWVREGGCCMVIDVFADHLVIHRRSVRYDEPIGEDWSVPLPAAHGRGFDFAVRARETDAPQFAPGARATAAFHPNGHPDEVERRKGTPCVSVEFPAAQVRRGVVFNYAITAECEGKPVLSVKVVANGFGLAKKRMTLPGLCLIAASRLPKGKPITFAVAPVECFGKRGAAIRSGEVVV